MKTKLLLILFLSLYTATFAQFKDDEECVSKELSDRELQKLPWYGNNEFLYKYLAEKGYYNETKNNILYRVPIKFWIYRKKNKTGGVNELGIKRLMNDLNYYNISNKTGIVYYVSGIKYINKDKRSKLGYYVEAPMLTIFRKSKGCINVHITDMLRKRKLRRRTNIRGTYNTVTKAVILQSEQSKTSLTHEIGHYFGLLHPHRNYKKRKGKQEAVSRTRKFKGLIKSELICETNGDALCDTHAEPKLSKYVSSNCTFTGANLKDKWGDNYKSSVNNIMSYPAYRKCRTTFTKGQIAVMLYTASRNKNKCAWSTNCKKGKAYKRQYNFDVYEPDNTMKMASMISLNNQQYHTFHKIYKGKNKKETDKDIDWLKFKLNSTNKDKIVITTDDGKFAKSNIEMFLYDQNGNLITQSKAGSSTKVTMRASNLVRGWYYIKVNKTNKIASPNIADYKIIVTIKK